MPKIVQLTSSCEQCPNHGSGRGRRGECILVGEAIPEGYSTAPFCTLTDYPSHIIANMAMTIRTLREPNKYGLYLTILSHVATKLKTVVDANVYVVIQLKKDEERVCLRYDNITNITVRPDVIYFTWEQRPFKLYPDADKPELHEGKMIDGFEEMMWRQLELA